MRSKIKKKKNRVFLKNKDFPVIPTHFFKYIKKF